jgi:hypothetical protein
MTRPDSITDASPAVLSRACEAHAAASELTGAGAAYAAPSSSRRARKTSSLHLWTLVLALLAWLYAASSLAQDNYRAQMKGLDEQVQEIKSDVLSIAQELSRLEERLLYPSNTQLALFIALAKGEALRLDAVQIRIDGHPVAHYIYSFKELEALQKGGVQRIYTGNIPSGSHQLEVSVIGKLQGGKDYAQTERFTIDKGVEPKLVGISLAGPASGKPIEVADW